MSNGGIIGPDNIPSTLSASGKWSLGEQLRWIKDNQWPLGPVLPVQYSGLSESTSTIGTSVTVPIIASNQMAIFMEEGNTATPPQVRSGWTLIDTMVNTTHSRSMTLSYKLGVTESTETQGVLAAGVGVGYIIFNDATGIGAIGKTSPTATGTGTTRTLPPIAGIQNSNSALFSTQYNFNLLTGAESPYTYVPLVGAYLEGPLGTSQALSSFTLSTAVYNVAMTIEVKP